ncbi:replication initiator [Actinomadura hibisca]|uniref:replication initiator n=1 Tax=Actinomadura hibisca TaxID=68565 RepID=UPI0012FB6847|nr:replication initiator [Actinomadura hibisca]
MASSGRPVVPVASRRVSGAAAAGAAAGAVGGVLAGLVARVGDADGWRSWSRQVEHTRYCSRPVRVAGGADAVHAGTGEVLASYSTSGEADGALLLACGDRRAAVCASCAETYRRDTWHVIAAGLRGRVPSVPGLDGVPVSVAAHPVLLATLTAPSFGAVHRAADGPCRARAVRRRCPHGGPRWCDARHGDGDAVVGRPLCVSCYDYTGHVLWHAMLPELWRRTVIYTYRALARLAGARCGRPVTVREVRGLLRVSYVKVAEYQRRGAVHLHAVLRLDGVDADAPNAVVAPPAWADAELLAEALREAAGRVRVPVPVVGMGARSARWGAQLDVAPVDDPERAAAYLAKYATKTAGDVLSGLPPRRFGRADLPRISRRVNNAHTMLLVAECFWLSRRPELAALGLERWPHTLGFRGHFASKSRRYSVTLGTLRGVRRAWRAERSQRPDGDPWAAARTAGGSSGGGAAPVVVGGWRYLGTGWALLGDADLAAALARDHRAARAAADLVTVARDGLAGWLAGRAAGSGGGR